MPDQNHTIAKYAVATSLAAITLIYVFQPTFSIDGESSNGGSASARKRGIVGLSNPANDCFINSVLQALAGLGDLRAYLIRETHRRNLDGPAVYSEPADEPTKEKPEWRIVGRQRGTVTAGLKDILDALNERPIYKKTISAASFVVALEQAFKQRISRQQQDAQEFLQVVAERLSDEYFAGKKARAHARKTLLNGANLPTDDDAALDIDEEPTTNGSNTEHPPETNGNTPGPEKRDDEPEDEEEGFPLQGASESQIECLTCGFKPKPTATTFCSLTLNVPQTSSSTTLNACFDLLFKTERIEGFKCEKCRLVHALEGFQAEYAKSTSEKFRMKHEAAIKRLEEVITTNPEEELKDVELPDLKFAPKRKIDRHVRVTKFPKILAIHLSRSIFELGNSSMKNSAKVSFPERLRLGGLLDQKMYRLLSVVCHKGSHHSGHYESFRRQNVVQPFSTPNTFHTSGVYSKSSTPIPSQISTPQRRPELETSTLSSTPELLSPSTQSSVSLPITNGNSRASGESSRPNGKVRNGSIPTSTPRDPETSSIRSFARSAKSTLSKVPSLRSGTPPSRNETVTSSGARSGSTSTNVNGVNGVNGKKKKKASDSRWWRISDDKVKECKTGDVLGMQREVYMLFYELEKDVEV